MKTYLIHLTDIFHPHGDPDDHYDLATVFALHAQGRLELKYVVCDYPPPHRVGDPALCAIAQLNEITGSDVIGRVAPSDEALAGERLLELMREADRPVCFSIVGSTVSVASAIKKDPALFSKKCAGIYMCAGTGVETPGGALEYNVRLHASAYSTIFTAPCPVYWVPCYSTITPEGEQGGLYGSVYCIEQCEMLMRLPKRMQNYFLYMLSRSQDPRYLRYLDYDIDEALLTEHGKNKRRLWSTPALLTIGGVNCDTFAFHPVKVDGKEDGHLTWTDAAESNVQMLRLNQNDRETTNSFDLTGSYRSEMLEKMTALIAEMK